MINWEFVVIG